MVLYDTQSHRQLRQILKAKLLGSLGLQVENLDGAHSKFSPLCMHFASVAANTHLLSSSVLRRPISGLPLLQLGQGWCCFSTTLLVAVLIGVTLIASSKSYHRYHLALALFRYLPPLLPLNRPNKLFIAAPAPPFFLPPKPKPPSTSIASSSSSSS